MIILVNLRNLKDLNNQYFIAIVLRFLINKTPLKKKQM